MLISEVNKRFQNNMKNRKKMMDQNEEALKLKTHLILSSDPLYSNVFSNGYIYIYHNLKLNNLAN